MNEEYDFDDLAIEKNVIGTFINNGFLLKGYRENLKSRFFEDQDCRDIYRTLVHMDEQGNEIDVNSTSYALDEDVDREAFATISNFNKPDKLDSYVMQILRRGTIRQLEMDHEDYSEEDSPMDFIQEKIKKLEQQLMTINAVKKKHTDGKGLARVFVETLRQNAQTENKNKIYTGIPEVDNMTGGIEPTWLVVVAARPSMGKTTFALNIAENVSLNQQKTSLIFSLEMPDEDISLKFASSIGQINYGNLRKGTLTQLESCRVEKVVSTFESMPVIVDDTPQQSIEAITLRCKQEAEKGNLGVIIIDYLELITVKSERFNNESEKIAYITKALKTLAKELRAPIVILAQLNREIEKRADKRPVMSDLRNSGQIEQDADLIVFTYRDFIYTQNEADRNVADLICGKFRHGTPKDVSLHFEGKYSKFRSKGEATGELPNPSPYTNSLNPLN